MARLQGEERRVPVLLLHLARLQQRLAPMTDPP